MLNFVKSRVGVSIAMAALLLTPPAMAVSGASEGPPAGLEQVAKSRFDTLYWRPGASLQQYSSVVIADDIPVEFRDDWQRDQNRFRGLPNAVEDADAERIRGMMADSLRHVLESQLSESGGYPVVDAPGEGVLLLKPAIVELDVFAPDILTPNITRVFTQSTGRMTLQMDLYDAATNELVGRIVDRQLARDQRFRVRLTNRVTNRFESEIVMRRWGARLRAMLDESR